MNFIFRGCSILLSLPDISKWNTNNVTDMSYMFNDCSILSSLPDIQSYHLYLIFQNGILIKSLI